MSRRCSLMSVKAHLRVNASRRSTVVSRSSLFSVCWMDYLMETWWSNFWWKIERYPAWNLKKKQLAWEPDKCASLCFICWPPSHSATFPSVLVCDEPVTTVYMYYGVGLIRWLTEKRGDPDLKSHMSHISLLWLVVGLSGCIQSARPSRFTILRSNCQTRQRWSNMHQDSGFCLIRNTFYS